MPNRDRSVVTRLVLAILAAFSYNDSLQSADAESGEISVSMGVVAGALQDDDWIVVDARPTDAYNGWALEGIDRGGHLPGAVDFPASWLDVDDVKLHESLASTLRAKGISSGKHILLYSTNLKDRTRVANYLREQGYPRVDDFDFRKWSADTKRPLVRYQNYQLLVPASIVKQLLEGGRPETFEDAMRIKFVECSWGDETVSYLKGHVPGSFHINSDDFEPPPAWTLGDSEILTEFAENYGFQANDTIIVSGEDPTASYRLAVVLRFMGVRDVRVLNGGFAAWKNAGYAIETKRQPPPLAKPFGERIPLCPEWITDVVQVKAGLETPSDFVLVDTRSWAEFLGETSGYTYHLHKGRVPGSTYGQADFTGANSLAPYRNIDNTMRNADEILMLWRASGINTEKHLCFLCGGGWRAAEVLMFARVIGLENSSLYSDGWIGWSRDRTNPVESGPIGENPAVDG